MEGAFLVSSALEKQLAYTLMKKTFILGVLLVAACISIAQAQSLPEKIVFWNANFKIAEIEKTPVAFPLPRGSFYNKDVEEALKDSFLIASPSLILKVQALSFQNEPATYWVPEADFETATVGLGMMPCNSGNYWEGISLEWSAVFEKAKAYLMKPLIKDRQEQEKLYKWAEPTMVAAFKKKSDFFQARDIFAVWKADQYLTSYDYKKELARESVTAEIKVTDYYSYTIGFTRLDWHGKRDYDAKLYAFWHRKIKEQKETGQGFSLDDARYWNGVALISMEKNATPKALQIAKGWETSWTYGEKIDFNPYKTQPFARRK